jgi:hypothetical protein
VSSWHVEELSLNGTGLSYDLERTAGVAPVCRGIPRDEARSRINISPQDEVRRIRAKICRANGVGVTGGQRTLRRPELSFCARRLREVSGPEDLLSLPNAVAQRRSFRCERLNGVAVWGRYCRCVLCGKTLLWNTSFRHPIPMLCDNLNVSIVPHQQKMLEFIAQLKFVNP